MYSYLIKVASFPVFWGICPPGFPLSGAVNFSRIVQCVSSSGKSFCYRELGNSSIMSLSWSRLLAKLCVLCKPLLRAAAGERLWYQVLPFTLCLVPALQPSPAPHSGSSLFQHVLHGREPDPFPTPGQRLLLQLPVQHLLHAGLLCQDLRWHLW